MRTFHALSITDIRAVRALREREKSGGPLSRYRQILMLLYSTRTLNLMATTQQSISPLTGSISCMVYLLEIFFRRWNWVTSTLNRYS